MTTTMHTRTNNSENLSSGFSLQYLEVFLIKGAAPFKADRPIMKYQILLNKLFNRNSPFSSIATVGGIGLFDE